MSGKPGPKPCVFCGQPGASDEHVFADWITGVMPGEGMFTTSGSGSRRTKTSKGLSIISRAPCVTCNTGWMSVLEQRAMSLLTPAIRGENVTWIVAEQKIVMQWCVKTALMIDSSEPVRWVPDDHYFALYRTGVPDASTRVWVASFVYSPRESFEAVSVHRKQLLLDSASAQMHGYRITFNVGRFIARVLGVADAPELAVTPPVESLHELWPGDGEALDWPPAGAAFDAVALKQILA